MSKQYNTAYQRLQRDRSYARSMAQFENACDNEGWHRGCEIERFEWRSSSYMMFVKGIFKPINIKEWARSYFGRVTQKVRDVIESNAPDTIDVYCSVDTIYQQGCPYNYGGYVYRFTPSDKTMNLWMQKAFGPERWDDVYDAMYPIYEKYTEQINNCPNQMWTATLKRVYFREAVLRLDVKNIISGEHACLYASEIISEQEFLEKIEKSMNKTLSWNDNDQPWPPKEYRDSDNFPTNMRIVAVA